MECLELWRPFWDHEGILTGSLKGRHRRMKRVGVLDAAAEAPNQPRHLPPPNYLLHKKSKGLGGSSRC